MAEPAPESIRDTVSEAVTALLPFLDADAVATVVMGHSFGAVLAAEAVARLERERPGRIARLVVSAKTPPPDPSPELERALSSDQALTEWLLTLGGTPEEMLQDPTMREMILAPLRADLTLSLGHQQPPPSLHTPLLAVSADGDTTAPPTAVEGWQRFTDQPTTQLRLHGGHHAVFEQSARLHEALRQQGSVPSAASR